MYYLYQSTQHTENVEYFTYDNTEHIYDANAPIATVRCFWQHIVSSTVGANLVNIQVCYTEEENCEEVYFDENILDHHSDGNPVTVGYLARLIIVSF